MHTSYVFLLATGTCLLGLGLGSAVEERRADRTAQEYDAYRTQVLKEARAKPDVVAAPDLPLLSDPAQHAEPPWHALGPHTFVMHDDDRNVTCWGTKYGMGCLPDKAFHQQ